jgi:hypothetical protein
MIRLSEIKIFRTLQPDKKNDDHRTGTTRDY